MNKQISRRELLGRGLKAGIALAMPTILTGKSKANAVSYNRGKLEIENLVIGDFDNVPYDCVHDTDVGGTEGYDYDGLPDPLDLLYKGPPEWTYLVTPKIVSVIYDGQFYRLRNDVRPTNSFTPVNLELSLHSESESDIAVTNVKNELHCSLPNAGPPGFYDFGIKPLTLWRRFLAEPDKLQFLADIREACAKQGGTGVIPLPNLDGEYQSQAPYDYLQLRFDVYPGDFNLDGKIDIKDLPYTGNDWSKRGQPLEFIGDITGPQGLPDGNVDGSDLERGVRDWLRNIRDIMSAE